MTVAVCSVFSICDYMHQVRSGGTLRIRLYPDHSLGPVPEPLHQVKAAHS